MSFYCYLNLTLIKQRLWGLRMTYFTQIFSCLIQLELITTLSSIPQPPNLTIPTYMQILKKNYLYCFQSVCGKLWMWRAHCVYCSTSFYTEDLAPLDFGIWQGSWNQSPIDTKRQLCFGGIKSYIQIFTCTGVGTPNPCIVQGCLLFLSFWGSSFCPEEDSVALVVSPQTVATPSGNPKALYQMTGIFGTLNLIRILYCIPKMARGTKLQRVRWSCPSVSVCSMLCGAWYVLYGQL